MPLRQSLERSGLEFNCGIDVVGEFSGGHLYDSDMVDRPIKDFEWYAMLREHGTPSEMIIFSEKKNQAKYHISGTALAKFLTKKKQKIIRIPHTTYNVYVAKLSKAFIKSIEAVTYDKACEILWGGRNKWYAGD